MPENKPVARVVSICACVFLAHGCGKSQPAPGINTSTISGVTVYMSPDAERVADIQESSVDYQQLDWSVVTTGEVLANANLMTHVTTPVTGRISDVAVSVGDRVSEGQELLTVRSNDIEQSEADLLQNIDQVSADLKRDLLDLESQTETTRAQIQLSQSIFNRMRNLVDEKIASRANFEAAHTQFEKDKISLDSLYRKKASTIALSHERMRLLTEPIIQKLTLLGVPDAEIDRVKKTREVNPMVPVLAPTSGIISTRSVNVGELVDPTKPLFTIGDFHDVWIKADVYEKDVSKIREGQTIEVEVDSFPNEKFKGTLNYVADSIDPSTRTLSVRADVPNPGLKLKPDMFVRMTILVGEQRVLSIPETAVQDAGTDKVVYVSLGNGRYEERKVKLGGSSNGKVEVLAGLKPGEKVVTKGSFDLRAESVRATG